MIPKILHFIWIGDKNKFPSYGNYAIDAFQKMNPGFEINLTQYDRNQIIQLVKDNPEIKQIIVDACKQTIQNFNDVKNSIQTNFAFWNFFKNIYTTVSNNFRPYLIGKNGGIYLDLDCYPIRPFDETILNEKCFCVRSQYRNCGEFGYDWYCVGGQRGSMAKFNDMFKGKTLDLNPVKVGDNIEYSEYDTMRKKFKNCEFSETDVRNQDKNGYFYHFAACEKFN